MQIGPTHHHPGLNPHSPLWQQRDPGQNVCRVDPGLDVGLNQSSVSPCFPRLSQMPFGDPTMNLLFLFPNTSLSPSPVSLSRQTHRLMQLRLLSQDAAQVTG